MSENVTKTARTKRINTLVDILAERDSVGLEQELKRLFLLSEARELDKKAAAMQNTLSMDEIVEEVNIVRKQRYEKQNGI
jgi:hypothetical protein